MSKCIVYYNGDQRVVASIAPKSKLNENELASKIVPDGIDYEVVDSDSVEPEELTAEQKIQQLESQQTARMLRQAALGDTDSIAVLQAIEDQIAELRLEL